MKPILPFGFTFALCVGAATLFVPSTGWAQSETEEDDFKMPEEGGGLPRAPMPEGGVPDGSQEALPQGDAEPEDRPPPAPPSPPPQTKPAPTPVRKAPPPAEPAPPKKGGRLGDFSEANPFGIDVSWNGYVRFMAEAIENDSRAAVVGRNDGFKLANARVGLRASKDDLLAYVSLEAGARQAGGFNDANPEFRVRLRDAYLRYNLSRFATVSAGRFKSPYDLGQLRVTAYRTFIDLPLESRGVLPTQGFEVEGMSQDRQLGIMVHRDHVGLTRDGFDIGYALALTNGNTRNLALNDNDRPAAFARLSLYWGTIIQLNLAGFTDNQTIGELPNLFDESVLGTEASFIITPIDGLGIEGQFLYQNRAFDSSGRPDVVSIGGHTQVAYTLWGITLAYRFSFYDPNLDDIEDADRVMEHTAGINYTWDALPLRLYLNGTLVNEQASRVLTNNRIAILAQLIF